MRYSLLILGLVTFAAFTTLYVVLPTAQPVRGQERLPPPQDAPGDTTARNVRAGDTLDVSVFNHAELSRVVTVQPDGSIAYPFVGRLSVAGRTVDGIADSIGAALASGYAMRDPKVSVAVTSFGERTVFVLGEVGSPGAYPVPVARPLSLMQLFALAGGLSDAADRQAVRLYRMQNGEREAQTLDFTSVERFGRIEFDIELKDGDTVFVPRAEEISVLGQVNAPGSWVIRPGPPLTVLRAIAQAQGFTRLADRDDVIWMHVVNGVSVVERIDTEEILEGKVADPPVSPGDLLYVTERTF